MSPVRVRLPAPALLLSGESVTSSESPACELRVVPSETSNGGRRCSQSSAVALKPVRYLLERPLLSVRFTSKGALALLARGHAMASTTFSTCGDIALSGPHK